MKHEQNALDAIRNHGGQVQGVDGDSVTFTLGGMLLRLTGLDGPTVSQFSDSIHGLVKFSGSRRYQCAPIKAPAEAQRHRIADAALWLWMNRATNSSWSGFFAGGETIIAMQGICQSRDAARKAPIELTVSHERNLRIEAQDFADKMLCVIRDAIPALETVADNSTCKDSAEICRHWAAQLGPFAGNVRATPWRTDTPPYDVAVLAEGATSAFRCVACYVEQPIESAEPHGRWYDQEGRHLHSVTRWMEIPQ